MNQALENGASKLMRGLALSAGAGAGAIATVGLVQVLQSQPELTMKIISDWGAPAVLALVVIYLFDRRMGQMIQVSRDNVAAMQSMAGAIDRVATKDYLREQERELLLDHLNTTNAQILREMSGLREMLIGISGGRA